MLTNKEIVQEMIIDNAKVQQAFDKLTNKSPWKDDLYSHVIIEYLEKDNKKLNELYNKGEAQFRYYFVMVVKNQLHSSTSTFYNIYRKHGEQSNEIPDNFNPHDDYNEEDHLEKLPDWYDQYEKILDGLHWYDRELWSIFVKKQGERGPIERIAEETKIPRQSIGNSIRATKEIIKRNLKL